MSHLSLLLQLPSITVIKNNSIQCNSMQGGLNIHTLTYITDLLPTVSFRSLKATYTFCPVISPLKLVTLSTLFVLSRLCILSTSLRYPSF
jgi:hypothetical protein